MKKAPPAPERYNASLSGEVVAVNGYRMERMSHQREYSIDGNGALYPPEQVGLPTRDLNGNQLKVIGELAIPASETEFLRAVIVKHSAYDGRSFHRIIALNEPERPGELSLAAPLSEDTPGLTLHEGTGAAIGRAHAAIEGISAAQAIWGAALVEASSLKMSREHLAISIEDNEVIVRDTSTNGTYIVTKVPKIPKVRSSYTASGLDEAKRIGALDANKYSGQHKKLEIINRHKPVLDGSVDLRAYASGREANVVDSTDREYSVEYERLYKSLLHNLAETRKKQNGIYSDADVMKAAYSAVQSVMTYDLEKVNAIVDREIMSAGSRDINIGLFIREGTGICRHMGLAAAWVLNRASQSRILSRRDAAVSEANSIPEKRSGHEWARFVSANGEVFIIDPAYKYVGPLADVPELEAKGHPLWDEYFTSPEEREYYEKLYHERSKPRVAHRMGRAARKLIG